MSVSEPDVRFTIPGPPRGWQRTGQRIANSKKTGKSFIVNYTTGETASDEWTLKRAATDAMVGRKPLDGPVDLRISAWFPVARSWSTKKQNLALDNLILPTGKPDFDNIAKLIDGLKGVVWRDDCLVTDFHFYKRFSAWPRTVLEVRLVQPSRVLRDTPTVAPTPERKIVNKSPLVGAGLFE